MPPLAPRALFKKWFFVLKRVKKIGAELPSGFKGKQSLPETLGYNLNSLKRFLLDETLFNFLRRGPLRKA